MTGIIFIGIFVLLQFLLFTFKKTMHNISGKLLFISFLMLLVMIIGSITTNNKIFYIVLFECIVAVFEMGVIQGNEIK